MVQTAGRITMERNETAKKGIGLCEKYGMDKQDQSGICGLFFESSLIPIRITSVLGLYT